MITFGKQVYRYEGVIPKSGKAVIEFGGHKLVHRSIKKDKSDLLVHCKTGIVVRAYPIGTDRSIVLNDLADNIEKLEHFISNAEEYIVSEKLDVSKMKELKPETKYESSMTHYSDGSCVVPRANHIPVKKKYNVKDAKW